MNPYLLDIQPLLETPHLPLRSYYVTSTAPVNVEQAPKAQFGGDPQVMIEEMAAFIEAHSATADSPHGVELVIQIHGYNTNPDYVKDWYRSNCEYMAQHYPPTDRARIFLCYHWPSEPLGKVLKDSIRMAQDALPRLLRLVGRSSKFGAIIALLGMVFGLLLVLNEGVRFLALLFLFMLVLIGMIVLIVPILTLLALRVSNYFRDTYRSTNYGVADLIELIRQLDATLVRRANGRWEKPLIKLSFIGHSMGAFVVTQTIRVLSDIFDQRSIATLDLNQRTPPPSGEIGNVYHLGRLVLVAPDISAESIISGRGNTLRTSLRRFEEAYLFTNEADLALRIASTVANYFSFPTNTQDGGYRLGTVMVRQPNCTGNRIERYGILNQTDEKLIDRQTFLDYLRIRPDCTLKQRQEGIWGCPAPDSGAVGNALQRKPIAELFTYFDCTDYVEELLDPETKQPIKRGVLGLAEGKYSLGLWDYVRLIRLTIQGKLDPHGGYIFRGEAQFVKRLIYGLGCVGFAGLLQDVESEAEYQEDLSTIMRQCPSWQPLQQRRKAQSLTLSRLCEKYQLQVLLSPERYNMDILIGRSNRQGY